MSQPLFDLRDAIKVLDEALLRARRLDAVEVPEEDSSKLRKGDSVIAQANRDVQYLQQLCERAAAEVGAAYWATRGYSDPLAD